MDPYQDASQHGYGQYGMPQTPDGMGGSGNRSLQNVAQACQYCKSRHSKCDGLHPCSTCVRRGRESECSYSAVKKRGPKPKKDLYEYCNKLLVELEVQKQIADYWKDQFLAAMKKKEGESELSTDDMDPNRPRFAAEKSPSSDSAGDEADEDMLKDEQSLDTSVRATTVSSPSSPNTDAPPSSLDLDTAAGLLGGFLEVMIPILPEYRLDVQPRHVINVWNWNRAKLEQMDDVGYLVVLYEHAVASCFGSRIYGQAVPMRYFAKKAEELMHILFFQKEAQNNPQLAQRLVVCLVMMCFYYVAEDRNSVKQSVIMLAYQIISMHRKMIEPIAMHRLYVVMMGLAETQQDRLYWYSQCATLAAEANINAPLAPILVNAMFIISSLHPKLDFSLPYPSFPREQLDEFMQRLDAVEGIVGNASHVFPVTSFLDAVAAFRILLIGCRIELHLLRGELDTARRILEIGVTLVKSIQRPFTHPFYFGIAAHTAAALALNANPSILRDVFTVCDRVSDILPGCKRLRDRVAERLTEMYPDAPLPSPPYTVVPMRLETMGQVEQQLALITGVPMSPIAKSQVAILFDHMKAKLDQGKRLILDQLAPGGQSAPLSASQPFSSEQGPGLVLPAIAPGQVTLSQALQDVRLSLYAASDQAQQNKAPPAQMLMHQQQMNPAQFRSQPPPQQQPREQPQLQPQQPQLFESQEENLASSLGFGNVVNPTFDFAPGLEDDLMLGSSTDDPFGM